MPPPEGAMPDWLPGGAALLAWLRGNEALLGWLAATSVVTFVGSLLAVPWLVVRIPADYFARDGHRPPPWAELRPPVRALLRVGKNVVGCLFVLAGIAMLVLPGQGVLTIVLGVLLIDFPGKREIERRIVARPAILQSINWLRQRKGQAPLVVGD
jgi:hypothetical protein